MKSKIRRRLIPIAMMMLLALGMCPGALTDVSAAEPSAPTYNWSGLYVGLFGGGAFGGETTATELGSTGGVFPAGTGYNGIGSWRYDLDEGFIGGGQIGYNHQIGILVLGLENELGYIDKKGSRADPSSLGLDTVSRTKVGEWYDVLAGRIGIALDRFLIYGKGGVAFTELSSRVTDNCIAGPCGGGTVRAKGTKSVVTGAVGGGLEYAFAQNWTLKAEYLLIHIDKSFRSAGPGGGAAAGSNWSWKHHVDELHTVKVGVNFKFNLF
jgi:outer membrane immunogenic protein